MRLSDLQARRQVPQTAVFMGKWRFNSTQSNGDLGNINFRLLHFLFAKQVQPFQSLISGHLRFGRVWHTVTSHLCPEHSRFWLQGMSRAPLRTTYRIRLAKCSCRTIFAVMLCLCRWDLLSKQITNFDLDCTKLQLKQLPQRAWPYSRAIGEALRGGCRWTRHASAWRGG